MCTLALYLRQSARFPLVVAANRDEVLARPAVPPACLSRRPWIAGGLDLIAGGTWLGVNQHGLAAGLLNRRTAAAIDPSRRSRGLLCLDCLSHETPAAALAAVQADAAAYNPFNLLLASPRAALVVQNRGSDGPGRLEITHLDAGVHVLTNLDVNDPRCPRIARAHGLFDDARRHLDADEPGPVINALRRLLADHSTPLDGRTTEPNGLCLHLGAYGTRSSSILLYDAALGAYHYYHAEGPPCRTSYAEVELPR